MSDSPAVAEFTSWAWASRTGVVGARAGRAQPDRGGAEGYDLPGEEEGGEPTRGRRSGWPWPAAQRRQSPTLINTWLGEERLVAFDLPGTTRDAIHVPFERNGQRSS